MGALQIDIAVLLTSPQGSGTGGAGLIGAGAYALATTTFGFSVHATLVASTILPIIMLGSYFVLLPLASLQAAQSKDSGYRRVDVDEPEDTGPSHSPESAGLLDRSGDGLASPAYKDPRSFLGRGLADLKARLLRARSLVLPYMLPLFLVYLAEYTINQGVAPTLLFPLAESPFKHYVSPRPKYDQAKLATDLNSGHSIRLMVPFTSWACSYPDPRSHSFEFEAYTYPASCRCSI
jgi:battenin